MRILYILIMLLYIPGSLTLSAQPYEHSLGVRAGYSSGIIYKGFFRHRMTSVEAEALYNRHGLNISALYEFHAKPFRSQQWFIYAGGGLFGGNWENDISMGVLAVGGIEYVVRDLPLSFSIDWKPMMNIYRKFEVDPLDAGVSFRYRFSL